jgi:hypothetical protein
MSPSLWSTGGRGRWRGGYGATTTLDTGTLWQRSSIAPATATPASPRSAAGSSSSNNNNNRTKSSTAFVTRGAAVLFALGAATVLASYTDNVSIVRQAGIVGRSSVSRSLRVRRAASATEDQPLLKYYHIPGTSLGDQMFAWSSTVGCATQNAMFPCTFYNELDDNARLLRRYFRGPFHQCADTNVGYGWDAGGNNTINFDAFRRDPADRQDVALYGALRSYLNFDFMADDVRDQFDLKAPYLTPTAAAVEPFETGGYITVGLHVRWDGMPGAEYLSRAEAGEFDPALHQPDIAYYDNAMNLMRRAYGVDKIRFLLASDDMAYVRAQSVFADAVDVVFIEDISPESAWLDEEDDAEEDSSSTMIRDFAILRQCQHMITSVGSFSWWAAYLGPHQKGGRVLYYDEWKRAHGEDGAYFPSDWVRVPEVPSEAEMIVLPLEPTKVGDEKSPYGDAGDLPQGVVAQEQENGASITSAVDLGVAPHTATSTESSAAPEGTPQDATADYQGEDVVDVSNPSPEGKRLPAEGEAVPSAPFDGVDIAYPPGGETAAVDDPAATATTSDGVSQDQPIVEGEDAVNISDSSSTGLRAFVKGLIGGQSTGKGAQEPTKSMEEPTENTEESIENIEEAIDVAEERRDAEVPDAAPEEGGAAEASEKSRRLDTDDRLRQAVQQEQEAAIAARRAAENDEPHKATLADADEMRKKAVRKMAMEQAAVFARNMGIPATTPKAPDVLELEMPE